MLLSFKRYKGLHIYLPLNTSHFHIQSVGSREKLYTSSSSEISDKKKKKKIKKKKKKKKRKRKKKEKEKKRKRKKLKRKIDKKMII